MSSKSGVACLLTGLSLFSRLQFNSFKQSAISQSRFTSWITRCLSEHRESTVAISLSRSPNASHRSSTLFSPASNLTAKIRPSLSTAILSTFNAANIFSPTGTGYLVDKLASPIVMAISCAATSLTAYLILGFATSPPLVFVFVVLFGLVASGFFATVSGGSAEIARKRNSPISKVIYSLMMVRGKSLSSTTFWFRVLI